MRRTTARIATALCLLAIPLSLTTAAGATSVSSSSTWSGSTTPGGAYTSVTMQFVVPRVSAACGRDSSVAIFDGLGGSTSLPFVQNGVTVTPAGVSAWSQVFDRRGVGPVQGVALLIRPGDRVRVSLSFGSHAHYLTFRWENLTLHRVANRAIVGAERYYNGSTADYVVERPWYPYQGAPLAAYGSVALLDARAARYGRWVSAADHNATLFAMRDAHLALTATTSVTGGVVTSHWVACR